MIGPKIDVLTSFTLNFMQPLHHTMTIKKLAIFGVLLSVLGASTAHAGLFDDDDARRAILDLRTQVASSNTRIENLTKSLLDLTNQISQLQQSLAEARGQNETLANALSQLQIQQKDYYTARDGRLKKLEPQKTTVEGVEGTVMPGEKNAFDLALSQFQKGDYKGAIQGFSGFISSYPQSLYKPDAQYWMGNAYYAQRDYKRSDALLQSIVQNFPTHPKAPEALLALANNQAETGKKAAARKTLQALIAQYAQTETAQVAKERLAKLSKTN